MKTKHLAGLAAFAFAILFVGSVDAFSQGRGGGRPSGAGGGNGGGRPSGMGVDRGLGNASDRSGGRSDDGLGNASTRSNGRSMTRLERARMGGAPDKGSNELRRYTGITKKLGTTPEALRASYDAALAANPDLKWGQFVSANVVSDNLGGRDCRHRLNLAGSRRPISKRHVRRDPARFSRWRQSRPDASKPWPRRRAGR